jgi:site-specific DNA-cytosine methylase
VGESVAGLPLRLARRHRVAALKALGNAIVPQVAEVIGRAIMQMEEK